MAVRATDWWGGWRAWAICPFIRLQAGNEGRLVAVLRGVPFRRDESRVHEAM